MIWSLSSDAVVNGLKAHWPNLDKHDKTSRNQWIGLSPSSTGERLRCTLHIILSNNVSHNKKCCLAFATDVNNWDKFGCHAIPAVMMGYSFTQKGYQLYKLLSHSVLWVEMWFFVDWIFPFVVPKYDVIPVPSTMSYFDEDHGFKPSPVIVVP